jgi:hypothetical protein
MTPDWVQKDPSLAPLLDYAWAQYTTRKGDSKAFYDEAARDAQQLGLQMVMGACRGDRGDSLGELRVPQLAVRPHDVGAGGHPDCLEGLMAKAKARPTRDCRRV